MRRHETIRVPSVVSYAMPKPLKLRPSRRLKIEAEVDVVVTQLG
jgi:hypothetical protein